MAQVTNMGWWHGAVEMAQGSDMGRGGQLKLRLDGRTYKSAPTTQSAASFCPYRWLS